MGQKNFNFKRLKAINTDNMVKVLFCDLKGNIFQYNL